MLQSMMTGACLVSTPCPDNQSCTALACHSCSSSSQVSLKAVDVTYLLRILFRCVLGGACSAMLHMGMLRWCMLRSPTTVFQLLLRPLENVALYLLWVLVTAGAFWDDVEACVQDCSTACGSDADAFTR